MNYARKPMFAGAGFAHNQKGHIGIRRQSCLPDHDSHRRHSAWPVTRTRPYSDGFLARRLRRRRNSALLGRKWDASAPEMPITRPARPRADNRSRTNGAGQYPWPKGAHPAGLAGNNLRRRSTKHTHAQVKRRVGGQGGQAALEAARFGRGQPGHLLPGAIDE